MPFTEYPKITGPFKRDPKSNELTREWISPELALLADLRDWNFTEKIDGTNVRVVWDGYRVHWRGRTDASQFSTDMITVLEHLVGGEDNETLFEQQFGANPATLYGELYGPRIQSGGIYRSDITFALFDVRIGGLWLTRESAENVAQGLGLDLAPLLLQRVSLNEGIEVVSKGLASEVAAANGKPNVFAEGMVGTLSSGLLNRRGERISVKVKHRDLYQGKGL
jgi:hypothetical protein